MMGPPHKRRSPPIIMKSALQYITAGVEHGLARARYQGRPHSGRRATVVTALHTFDAAANARCAPHG